MRVRKTLLLGCLTLLLGRPASPMAGLGIPAQEITQLLNHAQLIMQINKQVQAIEVALQTYEQLVQQGRMLTHLQWGGALQNLAELVGVVRQAQTLASTMSNLDVVFRQAYPGYLQNGAGFNAQYSRWNQLNMDTIQNVLRMLNLQAAQIPTEQDTIGWIRNFAQTATGQNQLLQAGTMMADQQVQQLQGLRQIMWAQVMSEKVYQARQINADAVQQGVRTNAFAPAKFIPVN